MDDDLPTLPDQPLLIFTREAAQKLVAAIRRRTVSVASGSIKVAAPHKAGKPDKTLRIGLGMRQTDDGVTLFLREASKKGDDSSAGSSGAGSDGSGDSASSISSASSQSPESPVSGSHSSRSSDESSRAPSDGSSHGHSHL